MEVDNIRIITSSDQAEVWDETIQGEIYGELLNKLGMERAFETRSAYAVIDIMPVLAGGIHCEVHLNTLRIDSICIARPFRKTGIGSKLLNQATSFAIESNCNTIQLNTYFKDNLSFFKRNRFQEVACIPKWKYCLDCYLMSKTI